MPTKTDRILSYLPRTFRALPKPTTLYSVVDAFGGELLRAENSLAAIMLSHWVDHADRGADVVDDLARIASLYGLQPRPDETVEEFREHLKRYVRTFLEGTVTVQGILRIVAEALALHIADDYAEMDVWWKRPTDELATIEPRGDDAASLLFGVDAARATGQSAQPAHVVGNVDLTGTFDLGGASHLRIQVDGNVPADVALTATTIEQVVEQINATLKATVASRVGNRLALASKIGPTGRLAIEDTEGDAAPRLLGLLPRLYHGAAATAATVTGTRDLSGGADLSDVRYIRLLIDGQRLAEIDCAGGAPGVRTLDDIRAAINTALGVDVAKHDGHVLTLTSQTLGLTSRIAFQSPAAQDATARLFGPVSSLYVGQAAQPASAVGTRNLSQGADLSGSSQVRIRMDSNPPVTVECAGADPAHTLLSEIVAALNAEFGTGAAWHDGQFVHLASPTTGPSSALAFDGLPPEQDATDLIFGVGPRAFRGAASTSARIVGSPDLSAGVNVMALHSLLIGVDDATPVEIDVRDGPPDPTRASLHDLTTKINQALKADVASDDGQHLILASLTSGGASRLTVQPVEVTRRRRFVTRAMVTDEAAQAVLGFVTRQEHGAAATGTRVEGAADLSRGVDLRGASILRIGVDGQPPRDVDCAAGIPRPRVAMLGEIVAAINAGLAQAVAGHDDKHLILASPSTGAGSQIVLDPRAADALELLLGQSPGAVRGSPATGVQFRGIADLSNGIDLPANAAIKLGVDATGPVEIALTDAQPAHMTINDLVIAINTALQAVGIVARPDNGFISLSSPTTGASSRIEFAAPSKTDVTQKIFGIVAPRLYHGVDAARAQVAGTVNLHDGIDLSKTRFLRLAVDGQPPVDVDCAAKAADAAHSTLDDIKAAIDAAAGSSIASHDGTYLTLTGTQTGPVGRIDLLPYPNGDARSKLLGDAEVTQGQDPAQAAITGIADLLAPVNLAERRVLRLSVDGDRPVDIDVAGAAPDVTSLDEIIAKINAVLPGVASRTDNDHLRLTSPTAGAASQLQVLPLRWLELIEYPPQDYPPQEKGPVPGKVQHSDGWHVDNDGAADVDAVVEITAPSGEAGPTLVNHAVAQRVRLMVVLQPGEKVKLWRDRQAGLRADIFKGDEMRRTVSGSDILVGPIGAQASVPFAGKWYLGGGTDDDPASLQLNNPLAPSIVLLRARRRGAEGNQTAVTVVESALSGPAQEVRADGRVARLVGRVRADASGHWLADAADTTLVSLRAGVGVQPDDYLNRAVVAQGPVYLAGDGTALMVADSIAALFDVKLSDGTLTEDYTGVTIGLGGEDGLIDKINIGDSQLTLATELDKGAVLSLPRGRSEWTYLDCYGARFDQDRFDEARFPGPPCAERGVFDLSRFANAPPEREAAVFAAPKPLADPPVEIAFHWPHHQPGAFVVNLPVDLPEKFGGRFDQARFALPGASAEPYGGVVTEPLTDSDHFVKRLKTSLLVDVDVVDRVPIGNEAFPIPFRHPSAHKLAGGTDVDAAQLYLSDRDVSGFIVLKAKHTGAYGNDIVVSVSKAGPARFDVTIAYQGGVFENARQIVLGQPLAALTDELLQPGPMGVLQAKAAGVHVDVTRDSTANQ